MKPNFEIELLEAAEEFLAKLHEKARYKIIYNLRKSQVVKNSEIFKKLNSNVWEFRTLHNRTYYRLFAFWDKTGKEETVVIATHGIEKKTAKIPSKEIARTEKIMKEYFEAKN